MKKKEMKLFYKTNAEDSAYGWENQSLPIGNGFMGANVFGIVEKERIQITENSLVNSYATGGLNNFAEIYFHFPHKDVVEYERGLILDTATAYVKYNHNDVEYRREYFASYPDRVLVIRFTASKKGKLSFDVKPHIPFIKDYAITPGDGGGKTGKIQVKEETLILKGELCLYHVLFEGQIKILFTDGEIHYHKDAISVKDGSEAVLLFTLGTNYKLSPKVFLEDDPNKKLEYKDPHPTVSGYMEQASKLSYKKLRTRHLEDYSSLFNRVSLSLNGEDTSEMPTDELLKEYHDHSMLYLESLYFQYGRYLLIASSRKGGLPANLQGIWNCHDASPWGSGYWHNINVQMNYWPSFNTNLIELFEPYVEFFKAILPKAQQYADEYIRNHNPENMDKPGKNGWTIGTASYPYTISAPGGHSGPGTGGLTSQLFWDYYDYTRDNKILENITYPALKGMAEFLTKTVKEYDGKYLTAFSASPEQMLNGLFVRGGSYYHTVGCAFDQQMILQNSINFLKAAKKLGKDEEEFAQFQAKLIDKYDPVQIGWSGQIKEYREENFYGEVGEIHHRHISHLIGLYPGNIINSNTEAWLDAAKTTLDLRGDESTGWALAHRMNARARTKEGNKCHKLLRELLINRTMDNLWDTHPPFQIDGNFGATAAIAEMLVQSHEKYVHILPALPDEWERGSFKGLTARGGFVIDVDWENHKAVKIEVYSKAGELLNLRCEGIGKAKITTTNIVQILDEDHLSIPTRAGGRYQFFICGKKSYPLKPFSISSTGNKLFWSGEKNIKYNVYRAIESQTNYTKIASELEICEFEDTIDFTGYDTITYRVTAYKNGVESEGICLTKNHATKLQKDIYINQLRGRNQI